LPNSPVSSSLCDASPHTFVGSPYGSENLYSANAERLFRRHRPN
jgi:hypothetical protein